MGAVDNVTRWTPTVAAVLREAGVPAADIAQYTAATLALIHYESRGNPTIVHRTSGAYGLTQQIGRWHPQHKGNPRAHLLHFAQRLRANTKPGGPTAGNVQSFLQAWASGPPALDSFVTTGVIPSRPPQFAQQMRNVQDMVAGRTWAAYASYVAAWIQAGQPTVTQTIDGRSFATSPPGLSGVALASPSDGYLVWRGKRRKVGSAGPGGVTNIQVRPGAGQMEGSGKVGWVLLLVLAAGGYLVWQGAK